MPVYPEFFRPKATDDLIRLGSAQDGGYVIPERTLQVSGGLLSFGLSDEFDFEQEFHARTGVAVACFDHTVGARFWMRRAATSILTGIMKANPRILKRAFRYFRYRSFFSGDRVRHIRKAIGFFGSDAVDLKQAIAISGLSEAIFLKMDIEGWEYRVLDSIAERPQTFCAIAMELHDIDLHVDRIRQFLSDVSDDFLLVHFHPNTHTQFGPDGIALAVELTLMSRQLLKPSEPVRYKKLPLDNLDAPNLPGDRHNAIDFS